MHGIVSLASVGIPSLDWNGGMRIVVALVVAGALILIAYWKTLRGLKPDKTNTGNFVAFNVFAATIVGAAAVEAATWEWPTVLLVAGACMGVGFVFGLLFGYPLSNKPPNGNNAAPQPPNLFQQSADSLSKLIAGATLVQAGQIYQVFQDVARDVSKCAKPGCCGSDGYVFGAGVTLYFLVVGFLAGLLLPHFYNLITAVPDGNPRIDGADKKQHGEDAASAAKEGAVKQPGSEAGAEQTTRDAATKPPFSELADNKDTGAPEGQSNGEPDAQG